MSEKKGPFDAARRILSDYADYGVGTIGEVKGRSCEAAIRVLEAAGGVDKKKALELINDVPRDERLYGEGFTGSGEYSERKQIRALLESLLEKEEK